MCTYQKICDRVCAINKTKSLPLAIGSHKGHAYVEYESQEDAMAAMDNMHLSEMYGNVIKVVNARGMKLGEFMSRPGTYNLMLF